MKNKLVLAGIISCFTTCIGCTLDGQQIDKKPVGFWQFEEVSGTQINDSSGNDNKGTISKDMLNVKRIAGRTGSALEFSLKNKKSGSVVLADFAKKYKFFSTGITIEAWIKPSNNFKRESIYEIVSNAESDRGKGFRLIISWGTLSFKSGEGGAVGKTWGASSKASAHVLKPEVWYHVAGVFDGAVFCVYIDGELVGQTEPGQVLTAGRKDVYIGSYANGYAYGFDGVIDEVKIYDYPRTSVQILEDAKK